MAPDPKQKPASLVPAARPGASGSRYFELPLPLGLLPSCRMRLINRPRRLNRVMDAGYPGAAFRNAGLNKERADARRSGLVRDSSGEETESLAQ